MVKTSELIALSKAALGLGPKAKITAIERDLESKLINIDREAQLEEVLPFESMNGGQEGANTEPSNRPMTTQDEPVVGVELSDSDSGSDIEILEIQHYEEDTPAPQATRKRTRKKKITKAMKAQQKKQAAAKRAAARLERQRKEAEEERERRRQLLASADIEIFEIPDDDDDDDEEVKNAEIRVHSAVRQAAASYQRHKGGKDIKSGDKTPVPIVIQTNNFPYLLSPVPPVPQEVQDSITADHGNVVTLFDEPMNPAHTLYEVFESIKEMFKLLGNPFADNEELVVRFKEFEVSISESSIHAHEVLLSEVYEAFNALAAHKPDTAPKCLCLELSTQESFVIKIDEFRRVLPVEDLVDTGEGQDTVVLNTLETVEPLHGDADIPQDQQGDINLASMSRSVVEERPADVDQLESIMRDSLPEGVSEETAADEDAVMADVEDAVEGVSVIPGQTAQQSKPEAVTADESALKDRSSTGGQPTVDPVSLIEPSFSQEIQSHTEAPPTAPSTSANDVSNNIELTRESSHSAVSDDELVAIRNETVDSQAEEVAASLVSTKRRMESDVPIEEPDEKDTKRPKEE